MIDPNLYATFVAACVALAMLPGPNMALITGNSVAHGARAGLLTALATATALGLQLVLVVAGLATLLDAAGWAFGALRWCGVIYLIWLGLREWRTAGAVLAAPPAAEKLGLRRIAPRAAAVALTNPKTLLFYAALFPQFVDPTRPAGPQVAILGATLVSVALAMDSLWALLAARMRRVLLRNTRLHRRISGTLLIGAGAGLALARAK